ncbi:hypothetical protein KL86DPRO_11061 [uncultured delta proteobacterium]|uniref:Uncharacterized protein n=1 Tax=uncultured delta proteobacterium TaxID=34034 RepID=A0A212JAR1_9DELT|nr:hypothetical protein KL86DPRO_11061 [uncultured delta proteobacterium]
MHAHFENVCASQRRYTPCQYSTILPLLNEKYPVRRLCGATGTSFPTFLMSPPYRFMRPGQIRVTLPATQGSAFPAAGRAPETPFCRSLPAPAGFTVAAPGYF